MGEGIGKGMHVKLATSLNGQLGPVSPFPASLFPMCDITARQWIIEKNTYSVE